MATAWGACARTARAISIARRCSASNRSSASAGSQDARQPLWRRGVGVERDHRGTRGHEVAMRGRHDLGLVQHDLGRPQRTGRARGAGDELLAHAAVEQDDRVHARDLSSARPGPSDPLGARRLARAPKRLHRPGWADADDPRAAGDLVEAVSPSPSARRRPRRGEPWRGEGREGSERGEGPLTAQGDRSEAFEPVEEALDEVALHAGRPADGPASSAGRILLELRPGARLVGDEAPQRIGGRQAQSAMRWPSPSRRHQVLRLRAVAPLPRRDLEAHRTGRGMALGS